ncbi:MAG TPA: Ig-like domain-containing protein, partial [bacterium]
MGLSTCAIKLHANSTAADLDKIGLAVALDAASTTPNGYLIWIYNGFVRVKMLTNGNGNDGPDVNQYEMAALQPGDVMTVSYRKSTEANYFNIQVNNGTIITLRDVHKYTGNGDNLYAGVMFRRSPGAAYNYLVDNFTVQSQLPDVIPPGKIWDLAIEDVTNTSIAFSWTAVGNDEYIGQASSYDMRYATSTFETESDFANASIVTGLITPSESGTREYFRVSGLQSGRSYYFAIRAIDSWGNKGVVSEALYSRTNSSGEVTDDFNRETEPNHTIGPDWVIDGNQYRIDYNSTTQEGEFVNYQGDGAWGTVSVYRARTNPTIVKMIWGRQASDESIGQGGLALMLTSPTVNTDGYLLWVRRQSKTIYLYEIDNGEVVPDPDGRIDKVAYTLRDNNGNIQLPQKGDTMSVIMDWTYAGGHRFDVFINGRRASDVSLFDPMKKYNSAVKYAGIMLGRLNRTNNVTAFTTSAEYTGASQIRKYSGNGQTGTVGTTLQDSLKILVLDGNNTALPNAPVYFSVINPATASVSAPAVVSDPIQIETEWGLLTGTYSIKEGDPGASGNAHIVATAGLPESGLATYRFYVDKDTTYWFWGRMTSPGLWNSTVFILVDGNKPAGAPGWIWNSLKNRWSDSWQWDRVNDSDGPPISMRLTKGTHTLKIIKGHSNVKIDKILITYKSNYIPTGTSYVAQLFTNSNGYASTKLTLGQKAQKNTVLVRAFGIPDTVQFYATALPGAPISMVKTTEGQNGAARDTLAQPLTVILYDQYNNPVPNVTVHFRVVSGDGTVLTPDTTTNANGQASTRFVLGIQQAENKVRATVTGYTVTPVEFTSTATSGLVKKLQVIKVTIPGRHLINQVLPNFLKVKVLDETDHAIDKVGVTFQATSGPGLPGVVQPKKTDSQGIALDTLRCGSTAGIVRVIAKVGAVQDTVVRDSVFFKGVYLDYNGGGGASTMVNDTLGNKLRVKVTDSNKQAVANHPVSFVTKAAGFHFLDGSDSLVVLTGTDGVAKINVRVGSTHGTYPNAVVARSTDGFFPLKQINPNIPPRFTISVQSAASRLIKMAGDSVEGVVQSTLKVPLTVKMVDNAGRPVEDQPVDWVIKAGGGQFEGTPMPNLRITTDGDGLARLFFTLGPTAGNYNNVVEASATNGILPLYNSPIQFRLSAKSSAADAIVAITSKILNGTVGRPLPNPVEVMLTDVIGNGVGNAQVKFSVTRGGGALDGTADTTKTIVTDNAAGIASIRWTLGTKTGTGNNWLDVSATNGLLPLKNSPVRFTASGVPDSVSAVKSTITATGPVQATGKDTCWITIALTDAYGNPVPGKQVRMDVTGGDNNYYYPYAYTDALGKAKLYLVSISAGEKQIQAAD